MKKTKYRKPRASKCPTGKKSYHSEVDAKIKMFQTNNFIDNTGANRSTVKRTYNCNLCPGIHLTSKPLRVKESV